MDSKMKFSEISQKRNDAIKSHFKKDLFLLLETHSKKTLAKILFSEFPQLFNDVEAARGFIRYHTGSTGETKRAFLKGKGLGGQISLSTQSEGLAKLKAIQQEAKLKESERKKDIVLLDCNILFVSDIHSQHCVIPALDAALEDGIKNNCDTLIIGGDLLDFAKISRYTPKEKEPSTQEELGLGVELIEYMKSANDWKRIIFIEGNHEARWNDYLFRQVPEVAVDEFFSLQNRMGLKELGVEYTSREVVKAGKLNIMHGHEFGEQFFSPVNPARGMALKAGCSVLFGHHHQPSKHAFGDINNGDHICVSVGCLSRLDPMYRPFAFTKWKNGHARVNVDADGYFDIYNKTFKNGRLYEA